MRSARQARHLAALKKLVHEEQWPWAQQHAGSFVRYAADVVGIEWLGYQERQLLDNGALQDAVEQLLMDIAKLESEKTAKRR